MYPKRNKILQIGRETTIQKIAKIKATVFFGGYSEQFKTLKSMVEDCFNIGTTKGCIIYGQRGTGKATLSKCISESLNASLFIINSNTILSSYFGETEVQIKSIFNQAVISKPSVVLIKDMNIICENREANTSSLHYKITNCLLSLLDGELDLSGVFVIGTTTNLDDIDDAFKRSGRFEKDLELHVPEWQDRLEIFKILRKPFQMEISDENELTSFIQGCHGYVGADMLALLKYAHYESLTTKFMNLETLKIAKSKIKPSALKDVLLTVPNVRWDDIGGQEETKLAIKSAIELPFQKPELFEFHNISPPCGLLLYGPPGTGKTLLAKAVATESSLNFLSVKGSELFNKYVGESEKALKGIFDKARSVAPVVIFFDEIDAIGKKRGSESGVGDRMLVQLLTELDGIQHLSQITVIAATNRPDTLDPALIRPGRFDKLIYVAPPDLAARKSIFSINCSNLPCDKSVDTEELANLSDGCTGAEIKAICQEAAFEAIESEMEFVTQKLLATACYKNKTRLDEDTMRYYKQFQEINK